MTEVMLPNDLNEWIMVRTTNGERFLGKPAAGDDDTCAVRLQPAYEYLQQVHIRDGKISPPARILVPLEFQDTRQTVDVVPSAITYLREASAAERRMWVHLIEQAEQLRKQIALANNGFVTASSLPPSNGVLRT